MRAIAVRRWWRHLVAVQMLSLLQIGIHSGEGSGLRGERLMKWVRGRNSSGGWVVVGGGSNGSLEMIFG